MVTNRMQITTSPINLLIIAETAINHFKLFRPLLHKQKLRPGHIQFAISSSNSGPRQFWSESELPRTELSARPLLTVKIYNLSRIHRILIVNRYRCGTLYLIQKPGNNFWPIPWKCCHSKNQPSQNTNRWINSSSI